MKPRILSKKQLVRLKFRNERLQESSIYTYGYAVRSYFKYLMAHGYDDQFDIEHIREWIATHDNPYTYNIRLQGLKEFYMKQVADKSAVQRLRIREAFESIKRMRPAAEKLPGISYLKYDQVEALGKVSSERVSCFVMALFWTGCRISEMVNIRLKDCKVHEPVNIRVIGKGMKERWVYLPRHEFKRIRRVFEGQEYLFETRNGTQYSRKRVSREIKRQAMQKLDLNVHAHTLRHSKAMYLKDLGLSPDQIARALGHSTVTTTLAYYLHGTPSAQDQGIDR